MLRCTYSSEINASKCTMYIRIRWSWLEFERVPQTKTFCFASSVFDDLLNGNVTVPLARNRLYIRDTHRFRLRFCVHMYAYVFARRIKPRICAPSPSLLYLVLVLFLTAYILISETSRLSREGWSRHFELKSCFSWTFSFLIWRTFYNSAKISRKKGKIIKIQMII